MSDSRVEKYVAQSRISSWVWVSEPQLEEIAQRAIARIEAAGLLVIDPDDEATKERLRILLGSWFRDEVPATRADYLAENIAVDILTVLGEQS